MPETGYLYIYTNNESNQDVNFNDMRIAHYKGRVIEEDHYYPYGMVIEPLSWSATAFTKNGYKYQDKNLQTQLDYYHEEFFFRHYDPALGRWNVADPMSQFFNPYIAMGDNPVSQVDPLGSWVHTGPSAGGMVANAQAEGMRNIQKQLTQMNYNAAMAAGTPGGGGMPFVMNRGGSYWLAPSQEQMDYMAISGSTVMASGNGQVFSINNQGELILGHYEQTSSPLYQVDIYGTNGSMATLYTDGSTSIPIETGGMGVTSHGFMLESGLSFVEEVNLGDNLSQFSSGFSNNVMEGVNGGSVAIGITEAASYSVWGKAVNKLTNGISYAGKALGLVSLVNDGMRIWSKFEDPNAKLTWEDWAKLSVDAALIASPTKWATISIGIIYSVMDGSGNNPFDLIRK